MERRGDEVDVRVEVVVGGGEVWEDLKRGMSADYDRRWSFVLAGENASWPSSQCAIQ